MSYLYVHGCGACEKERAVCVPVCVWVYVCARACFELHRMQVESSNMIVFQTDIHFAQSMTLVGGGRKCNNDDVQSLCVYKRAL